MSLTHLWHERIYDVAMLGDVFIETGTKAGDTLWEAKDLFPVCHSIEINPGVFSAAVKRFADFTNVHIHLGDSRDVLPKIIDPKRTTTFYLDAHCEGSPSVVPEADTECPLLGELRAILAVRWGYIPVVIVDDIKMFKEEYWTDPESNHHLFKRNDWPTFHEIAELLRLRYWEDPEGFVGIWV